MPLLDEIGGAAVSYFSCTGSGGVPARPGMDDAREQVFSRFFGLAGEG